MRDPCRIDFEQDGFSILPSVFEQWEVKYLIDALSEIEDRQSVRSRGGTYAVRNLLKVSSAVKELADSAKLKSIVQKLMGEIAMPVRGTLFDKTPTANWLVPWHQDLTVCVVERIDVPGYGPWTIKAGVHHVQPPVSVLEGMLAVRIHLDDCNGSNGALRVVPGSHKTGRIGNREIQEQQRSSDSITCGVPQGGVLLMRPLLLHPSSAATRAGHRRVIHIEYASAELGGGLRWPTV